MKKAFLGKIITLCLTAALLAGLFVPAWADSKDTVTGYMVPHTVEAGDTLYSICQAVGSDCDSNLNLICAFSGLSDARYIYAGKVVWLPVSNRGSADTYYTLYSHTVAAGDTWYSLCNGYSVNYNNVRNQIAALNKNPDTLYTGTVVTIPVLTAPAAPVAVPSEKPAEKPADGKAGAGSTSSKDGGQKKSADTSFKYVVPVVLKSGDTVLKICKELNTDFDVYSSVIMKINGISGYNSLPVGKELFIPTNSVPSEGTCYKIITHTVESGDTVMKICKDNSVDYESNAALIKKLNPSVANISCIYVGQKLIVPVLLNGKDPEAASASGEKTLSSIMILSSDDGEIISTVNGEHKTSASAGEKVTLKITPAAGKHIDKVTVTENSTKKEISVDGVSFTMPAGAVTVKVTFK